MLKNRELAECLAPETEFQPPLGRGSKRASRASILFGRKELSKIPTERVIHFKVREALGRQEQGKQDADFHLFTSQIEHPDPFEFSLFWFLTTPRRNTNTNRSEAIGLISCDLSLPRALPAQPPFLRYPCLKP